MPEIIEDPTFDEFDGSFVLNSNLFPKNEFNLTDLMAYLKDNCKSFSELSKTELKRFRT